MKSSARKGRARVAGASGQALVPALLFLLVGSIGLYVAFNSFQMTSAKIKLQNTADAAAYSAAVLQARDYNFSAYINRAMIANQVTAAQLIALKSWIDELDTTYSASNIDNTVKTFADHPTQWSTPKSNGKIDVGPARITLDALLPTLVSGVDSITRALSDAQGNFHAAMLAAVPNTADAVAQLNQSDTHVTQGYFSSPRNAVQLAAWKAYTVAMRPAGTIGSDQFADVVTDPNTLDGFVKNRNSSRSVAPNYQQISDTANRYCRSGGTITITVSHAGGTQLRRDKLGWQSIDGSTAHLNISCLYSFDAVAGEGGSGNGNLTSYWANPKVAAISDWTSYNTKYFNYGNTGTAPGQNVDTAVVDQFSKGPGTTLDATNGGLLPYQAMNGAPLASQAPRITIEVTRNGNSFVKTAGLSAGGPMKVDTNAAGNVMRALSSANAYFVRPNETSTMGALLHAGDWARADGKTEYPSLFSPYWQASLAPVSASERAAAQASQISAQQ